MHGVQAFKNILMNMMLYAGGRYKNIFWCLSAQ